MKLIDAMRTNDTVTENGMAAHSSTLNHCLDLFSQIGALRGKNKDGKINLFAKAFAEDALTAMKILFWTRDVRGGAGERQTSNEIIVHLATQHKDVLAKNIHLIPEYGRWSDLLCLIGTPLESHALELIAKALAEGNGLCAKWMPRPNAKTTLLKNQVRVIRKHLGLEPKEYRALLTSLSKTVEQQMCANEWDAINYSHVPSKAMANYMKTFGRHDYAGFSAYLDSVQRGDVKINASAVYPYDIIKSLISGNSKGANAQWDALPNFLEGSNERCLPMVDVSGSMYWPESKISGDLFAGHVAMSMGLYVAERNLGPFKDAILTFHSHPSLQIIKGNLTERYNQLRNMSVGGSTNIEATFKLILDTAIRHSVPSEEMPTMVLIFSDMQFDVANGGYGSKSWNPTAQEMIEKMYADAGYEVPKVVYWQLNARIGNQPVQKDKMGTALVSGFSPAILSNLLGGKDMSPYTLMMDVVNSDRYSPVTV